MPFEWKFYKQNESETENPLEIIHKKRVVCAFCRGDGNVRGGVCPICSGKGKNHVFPPLIRCRRCSGWGSYPMNSQSPCLVCRGRGLVGVVLPITFCDVCLGRGDTSSGLVCTKCHGTGVVKGQRKIKKVNHDKGYWGNTIHFKKIKP